MIFHPFFLTGMATTHCVIHINNKTEKNLFMPYFLFDDKNNEKIFKIIAKIQIRST
ncbi:hypothetical protein HMPREF0645_2766 [Hallella bergensis DSM 17361]|uniref:Uncharacterized protein n=1 Tax=Hallella bergensis DSM 17361 TaxID=585502 RepID=D1Q0N1_9BACT|nr:hypothetical protein HMPREF0645_2766 [Hallella bergensis DSM 17361]